MEFIYYIASSYTLLWVDTVEYDRVINNLSLQCKRILKSNCYAWDIVTGIQELNSENVNRKSNNDIDNSEIFPMQPIEFICNCKSKHNIIFCKDYHIFLNGNNAQTIELWRTLLNNINNLKQNNNVFVIVSPYNKIINEIERYFTIIDYELPNREELFRILTNFLSKEETENEKLIETILNNGLGLTEFEFENSLALSISKYGKIKSNTIFEQKKQLLKRNSCLELCNFDKDFNSIAGLDVLKDFSKKMIDSGNGRGICLVGIPGTGKSYFAKCLGKETNRITINLDFGKLMGGLVGETERNTKEALKTIDSLAPCILFIDEIEKGLNGMNSNGQDSGVGVRQGGQFLTWLNDHTSDVYVIATANDVSKLPSELLRAERWDGLFFIDLPSKYEQETLLKMYKDEYEITDTEYVDLEDFTGAEIKTLCRLSSSLKTSLIDTKRYITPVCKMHKEKIDELRKWAENRTINASTINVDENNNDKSVRDNVRNFINVVK